MIDPLTASMTVSLLAPFLVKAGESFAEKVGEKLAEKTGKIYKFLKESFETDEYAGLTLLRLEQAPEKDDRKAALEAVIKENIEKNSDFANSLSELLEEAKQADSRNVIASGTRSVAIGGDVNSTSINTGTINNLNK